MKSAFTATLAILYLCLVRHSAAEVKNIQAHGFIVENQIHTSKSPDIAWAALVNNVDDWWPKDHSWWYGTFSIEPIAGGCFCEVSEIKSAEHMRISFVDPGNVLRMTGGLGPLQAMGMHGALDWAFKATQKGTQITLTYSVSGISPDGFEELAPIVDSVQAMQLNSLGNYLAEN